MADQILPVVMRPDAVLRVQGVSMVFKGETIAVVGPSGCGKSTLFNFIAGLLRPTAGAVFVGSEKVNRARGQVGDILQRDLLLPWRSVLGNVVLGMEVRGCRPAPRSKRHGR